MPILKILKSKFFILALIAVSLISFQNCMPVKFSQVKSADFSSLDFCSANPKAAECLSVPAPVCRYNGKDYKEGTRIKTYLSSSVAFGQTCKAEERVCKNGAFTGSYLYATCNVGGAASCLFNGNTMAHGASVAAYTNSAVAFGGTCDSETRTCNNGVLSGSKQFPSCNVGGPTNCNFNGTVVAHGSSVTAYPTSSVPFGSSCSPQTRQCLNGTLTGSGDYGSCSPGVPRSCLFNGRQIPHAGSVVANETSSVAFGATCKAETRVCNDSVLSGSFTFETCSPGVPTSCTFNDRIYADGQIINVFKSPEVTWPQNCDTQSRTCHNGSFDGDANYKYDSCHQRPLKTLDMPLDSTATNSPFKLLIVIDNSNSMSPNQEKIAAKLDSLLTPLRGRNVDIKLVSTTDDWQTLISVYNDSTNALVEALPVGEYFDQNKYTALNAPIRIESVYVEPTDTVYFKNSPNKHRQFSLLNTDSAAALDQKVNDIKSAIRAFGTQGSTTEIAFCPILKELKKSGDKAFFKSKEKAAFIVLSDEDDQSFSNLGGCFSNVIERWGEPKQRLQPGYDTRQWIHYYYFQIKAVEITFSYKTYDTNGNNDGIPFTTPGVVRSNIRSFLGSTPSLDSETIGSNCSASLQSYANGAIWGGNLYDSGLGQPAYGTDFVLNSCVVTSTESTVGVYYNAASTDDLCVSGAVVHQSSYGGYDGKNLAQVAEAAGIKSANFLNSGCRRTIVTSGELTQDTTYTERTFLDRTYNQVYTANTAEKMVDETFAKARELFGDGFFMTYIVNQVTPVENAGGQSVGTKYIYAATKNSANAETVPIVATDFGAALSNISKFITRNLISEYTPALPANAVIAKVELISGGSARILNANEFSYVNGKLRIMAEMNLGDSLRITYAD